MDYLILYCAETRMLPSVWGNSLKLEGLFYWKELKRSLESMISVFILDSLEMEEWYCL